MQRTAVSAFSVKICGNRHGAHLRPLKVTGRPRRDRRAARPGRRSISTCCWPPFCWSLIVYLVVAVFPLLKPLLAPSLAAAHPVRLRFKLGHLRPQLRVPRAGHVFGDDDRCRTWCPASPSRTPHPKTTGGAHVVPVQGSVQGTKCAELPLGFISLRDGKNPHVRPAATRASKTSGNGASAEGIGEALWESRLPLPPSLFQGHQKPGSSSHSRLPSGKPRHGCREARRQGHRLRILWLGGEGLPAFPSVASVTAARRSATFVDRPIGPWRSASLPPRSTSAPPRRPE